jgi:hypothetical protein
MTEEELFALPLDEYLKARYEKAQPHLRFLGAIDNALIQLENSWLRQYIARRVK